jgi:hypothetical protein
MLTIHITALRLALVASVVVFAISWYLLSTEPSGGTEILCPGTSHQTSSGTTISFPEFCGWQTTYRSTLDVALYSTWRALLVAAGFLALNWLRKHIRVVAG